MTWSDASANAESWSGALVTGTALLDEASGELTDQHGVTLLAPAASPWSAASANAETWADA